MRELDLFLHFSEAILVKRHNTHTTRIVATGFVSHSITNLNPQLLNDLVILSVIVVAGVFVASCGVSASKSALDVLCARDFCQCRCCFVDIGLGIVGATVIVGLSMVVAVVVLVVFC